MLSILAFVLIGLNSDNIGYFLPKRLKKIGAILIASYCVGYSSVSFQTIANNKILTPSVMGLDSLYLFIQTSIVFFFGTDGLSGFSSVSNFLLSVFIMILSSILLYVLLFRRENTNVYFLVLAGMIIGTLFNGLATFMQVLLDPNEFEILQNKMYATFNNINEGLFFISLMIIVIIFIVTLKDYSVLDGASLGENLAINIGVDYNKVVLKQLIVISVLVAVSTALTGPIIFLGILVASLSRELMNTYSHRQRILCAFLLGVFSLTVGQFIVERVFQMETTISVIINFVGGLYFIYLMLKEAKV